MPQSCNSTANFYRGPSSEVVVARHPPTQHSFSDNKWPMTVKHTLTILRRSRAHMFFRVQALLTPDPCGARGFPTFAHARLKSATLHSIPVRLKAPSHHTAWWNEGAFSRAQVKRSSLEPCGGKKGSSPAKVERRKLDPHEDEGRPSQAVKT